MQPDQPGTTRDVWMTREELYERLKPRDEAIEALSEDMMQKVWEELLRTAEVRRRKIGDSEIIEVLMIGVPVD